MERLRANQSMMKCGTKRETERYAADHGLAANRSESLQELDPAL